MTLQQTQKVLTRQELYDLVWSTPMLKLAKQFRLSDNGLRKICKKHDIPLPKGGYWQKIQYGKSIKKPALPPYKGEDKIIITTLPPKEKVDPSQTITEAITVPKHLGKAHKLVAQTRRAFRAERKGNKEAVVDSLDIRVSPGQRSRACRIMNTIIKELEARGAIVGIDRQDEWKRYTHALIDGEKVHFALRERLKIEKLKPDPNWQWSATQEFVPNGNLELYISDYLGGLRTKWRDREKGRLEEKLTSFLNGLWLAAAFQKKRRLERDAEKEQQEQARKDYERKMQECQEEERKTQILEQQATSWKKSREIRSLVRAAIKKKGSYSPESAFAKWVAWATAYSDKLDPLKGP